MEVQTFRDFELIIVDDGSTDDTPDVVARYKMCSAMRITYVRQENAGPAKARNVAIGLSKTPICLFIGDDILCTPEFVERHYRLHSSKPDLVTCALGLTKWDRERQDVTPFMEFFESIQFAYRDLMSGAQPDWRYFYTSNLSVKKELLRQYPFDERFRKAAMEDTELGYRINQSHPLKIEFVPQALALHYHPTSLKQACRRNLVVGWSSRLFDERWPEAAHDWKYQKGFRGLVKRMISFTPLRLPLTNLCSWMGRFYCNASLAQTLLFIHLHMGYHKRIAEMQLKETQARASQAS